MKKIVLSLLLLLAALFCAPVHADNDGNNLRALEDPIISPGAGAHITDGYAVLPNGYVYSGYVYLFVHTFMAPWHPAGFTACDTSYEKQETKTLWKVPLSGLATHTAATFIGRVSPCSTDFGWTSASWGIGGTGAVGGNGKFYLTTNRTSCTLWENGCMDNEYLGAVANPDSTGYLWQLSPILAASPLNQSSLNWAGFVTLKSFVSDPLPSTTYFPRQTSDLGTTTNLWGYVSWGYVNGLPSHLARVQIAETAAATRPNWATTRTFLYGSDLQWHPVPNGGIINFEPYAAELDFGGRNVTSVVYDAAQGYVGLSEDVNQNGPGIPGCDEKTGDWYTHTGSPFYHVPWASNFATSAETTMGNTATTLWTRSTFTQNSQQIGDFTVTYNGIIYLFRGSTERICFNDPTGWWNPWIGSEITIETVP